MPAKTHTNTGNVHELNDVMRQLARRYARAAHQILGNELVSVALYGSVARGEAGPLSDIDLFVILREPPAGMLRRRRLLAPVREELRPDLEALWEKGIYTDFVEVIRSPEQAIYLHPLYLDMTMDAELLYDRDEFMKSLLAGVRRRLRNSDARRVRLGRLWYWDLQYGPEFGESIRR